MIEVVNLKFYKPMMHDVRVYIGRQRSLWKARHIHDLIDMSVLGNPFVMTSYTSEQRDKVVEEYRNYFEERVKSGKFRDAVVRLYRMNEAGHNIKLVCFCAPERCHGEIIKNFIDNHSTEKGEENAYPKP